MENHMAEPMPKMVSGSGYDLSPLTVGAVKIAKERKLNMIQRHVIGGGTEAPFTGRTVNGYKYNSKRRGTYDCAVCGIPAYCSRHKFESGTGWPSFYKTFDAAHVWETTDVSRCMVRKEVVCARCHAHQGHVFQDGPRPTGLRYCVNAAALSFTPGKGEDQGPPRGAAAELLHIMSKFVRRNKKVKAPQSPPSTA